VCNFLFKSYQSSIEYVNTIRLRDLNYETISLISNHSMMRLNKGTYTSNFINKVYHIQAINNYPKFIFALSRSIVTRDS
jgi:hypothetical protein